MTKINLKAGMKNSTLIITTVLAVVMVSAFRLNRKANLFILGDSISLQYGSYLEGMLKSDFTISRKGSQEAAMKNLDVPIDANGGDSRMVLSYLGTRMNDTSFHPDVMLLNCGLHDIKRNPTTRQIAVDSNEYRQNLEIIYGMLKSRKVAVYWVRTTEVIDSVHAEKSKAFSRFSADVDQYNRIADAACKKYNVPEIDLYTFTRKFSNDRFADHVHYVPKVSQQQAQYIAGILNDWKKQSFK